MASRKSSREFKLQVVGEIESGQKSVIRVCREHSLCDSVVRRWLEQYRQRGAEAFQTGDPQADALAAAEKQIRYLQGALGRSVMEVDFLIECLKSPNRPRPVQTSWSASVAGAVGVHHAAKRVVSPRCSSAIRS